MMNQDIIGVAENSLTTRKRLFEAGQMKLLILYFVAQSPKHSYDIIKDVAALVGGNYKPSTGTICPNINYLEEQEFIAAKTTADERKQYHITAKGQLHLQQNQQDVERILDRFNTRQQIQNDAQYVDIKRAMENLKTSLRLKIQHSDLDQEQIREIAEKIDLAAVAIGRL